MTRGSFNERRGKHESLARAVPGRTFRGLAEYSFHGKHFTPWRIEPATGVVIDCRFGPYSRGHLVVHANSKSRRSGSCAASARDDGRVEQPNAAHTGASAARTAAATSTAAA